MRSTAALFIPIILSGCSTFHRAVKPQKLTQPIRLDWGDICGWEDPVENNTINDKPSVAWLVVSKKGEHNESRIRLIQGVAQEGMKLISTTGHGYNVPMASGGGPAPPGSYTSGVPVLSIDITIEMTGGYKKFLILRQQGIYHWEDSLPAAVYYSFSDKPSIHYRILPGGKSEPIIRID